MKRLLLIFIALGWTSALSVAQADEAWKGLRFKTSTPNDVVEILGEPKRRRTEEMKVIDAPGGKPKGKKVLDVVEYEKIDGWEKVALTFMEGRLLKVKFWPRNKSLVASSLPIKYSSDFVSVEGLSNKVPLSVFEGQKEPAVPRVYDTVYYMISAKKDRYFFVTVNNGSWKAFTRQMTKKPTVELFPGFVEDIEIISRAWETI